MDGPGPLPPRGWYPDPGGARSWRWWDGMAWTEHLQPFAASQEVPRELLDREATSATQLLRIGVACIAALVVISVILRSFEGPWLSQMWSWVRHAFDVVQRGGTTASLPTPPERPAWISTITTFVVTPLQIISLILVLRFQHRAATVARQLRIPARVTPTTGVVGWFLPLANLVMPLLAWLGMLPASHPARALMWRCWIAFVVAQSAAVSAIVVAGASPIGVGFLSAVELAAFGICLTTAPRVIDAVVSEHTGAASTSGGHDARSGL